MFERLAAFLYANRRRVLFTAVIGPRSRAPSARASQTA